MYLIVGLGNPEEEYSDTRHNMGFDTINHLAEKYHISMKKKKFDAIYGEGMINGKKVILIKPQTYMNLSGKSVKQWMHFYQVDFSELLVIYDDMDIEKGQVKVRKKGGPGTHNGMRSVVQEIQSEEFARIRVGIGKPERKEEMIAYVIGKIGAEEKKVLRETTQNAAEAIDVILLKGIDMAMNEFN